MFREISENEVPRVEIMRDGKYLSFISPASRGGQAIVRSRGTLAAGGLCAASALSIIWMV